MSLRLPARNRRAKVLILQHRSAMMEFRHDEDAAMRDSIPRQKRHLLRDLRVRSRVRIVQRDDERFLGG